MAMDIDPRLREPSQTVNQPFSVLPLPSSYTHAPIRLPPPQQQQQQQQQQHHSPLPSWSQEGNHPYYSIRPEPQHNTLPSPDIHSHNDNSFQPSHPSEGFHSSDTKRPRACEACRGLKVKCDPDAVKGSCRRCAKAGRQCIVTAPSRKRQKKTDNRVAELEKKINALEASLHATKGEASTGSDDAPSDEEEEKDARSNPVAPPGRTNTRTAFHHSMEATDKHALRRRHTENGSAPGLREAENPPRSDARKRRLSEYQEDELSRAVSEGKMESMMKGDPLAKRPIKKPTDPGNIHPLLMAENSKSGPSSSIVAETNAPFHEYADVIDRKILDAVTATKIFEYYNQNMAPHMPIVVFSSDITAGIIRKTKPTLFLAILSIASAQDYPHLQGVLTREIMRAYADRLICKREKSLELIQALQVSTTWYSTDANFYQLIHLAAVMGIGLGISSRVRSQKERFLDLWRDDSRMKSDLEGKDFLDSKRAWLGCYFLCANAAMGSRRSNLIRWTSYIDECLHELETSEDALPSDKTLCQWVKLQRLADDLGTQMSTDDISHAGISDLKIQYALKGFERQISDWNKQKPADVTSRTLLLGFHVINLCMHDFAMPIDHGLENVQATNGKSVASQSKSQPEVLTTAHVGALTTCLTSVHGIFDSFLAFEAQEVRNLPIFHFARLARASVLLIRMYFAATTPDSELGKVISSDHMKVEHYLRGLIDLLRAAVRNGKCEPAHKLSIILAMMQVQFERSKEGKKGLVDEIEAGSTLEVRPVDTEKYSSKPGYKKMQLEHSNTYPLQRSPPKETAQPQAPLAMLPPPTPPPAPSSALAPAPPAATMGDRALQMLSEVAMSNPPAIANGHQGQHNGNEGWFESYHHHSTGGMEVVSTAGNIYPSEYYPPPPMSADVDPSSFPGVVLNGMHMHPGFEQAIGMTLGDGDLNILDDDGFYQIMQAAPTLFGVHHHHHLG